MAAEPRDDEVEAQDANAADEHEGVVDESRPGQRFEQQTLWVDAQIRRAMARGEFDDLPGAGKPIEGIGGTHDPEWWVKNLIKREQVTGIGPPAIMLRKEDADLDDRLDRVHSEDEVRRIVADFNARVVNARRQLLGGPPVVTPTRDIDAEVDAWNARRETRRRERLASPPAPTAQTSPRSQADETKPRRRRWWRPRRDCDR